MSGLLVDDDCVAAVDYFAAVAIDAVVVVEAKVVVVKVIGIVNASLLEEQLANAVVDNYR